MTDTAYGHSLLVSRPSRLSRFIGVSVVGHIALLVAAVLYARLSSGPKMDLDAKPIKASLVRLGKPRDPKLLPRKEQLPPPPKQVDAPKPPPDAPAPAPTPAAVAVPIPGVKPEPSSAPKPTPQKGETTGEDRRKRLFGAFDKTAKAAEEEPEGAEDGDPDGDSATAEGERYFGLLQSQVRRHYNVADTIPETERLRLNTVVAVRLGRTGEVLDVSLTKPSGNDLFDSAVVTAVRKAAPFSPPPEHLRETLQKHGVNLSFRPNAL
ncbi:TonB family protein [Pyxidicoccus fallax]|uniref:TonB family protein n=1 Tax=Pyxidicoccus fallax TaxID=394095 RepID=A0A848LMY0_9BACT|nr:TonB family protein [Pyxidicoccus fallax]NMO19217.1 TonB family protein [Pyxidicoccus fallax]NPC79900.1 TonB family protein [Pyxidicoccus fallax]